MDGIRQSIFTIILPRRLRVFLKVLALKFLNCDQFFEMIPCLLLLVDSVLKSAFYGFFFGY